MRIGFDGKRAVNNMTGLGNYSRLVLEALANAGDGEHQLLIYAPEIRENPRLAPLLNRDNVEFRFPGNVGFHGSMWRTFGIPNHLSADGVEIYHGLSNELPLNIKSGGVKSVVTIHDVIYRRLPSCNNFIDREIYDFKYGRSCRNADRIIAISECTKRDVMEFYGIGEDRIDVVYQGCDDIFRSEPSQERMDEIRRRYSLPERYIIQVGTVEWRKNLALTASSLAGLPADVKLVAVGRDRKNYRREVMEAVRKAGVREDRVLWTEGVPFADLPALYRGATASVLPSRYEGFGIPVIEAIECGTPFVGATGSCLEEAGGPSCRYVDPDSVDQLIDELRIILEGGDEIEKRISSAKEYVKKFDNSKMASSLMDVYHRAIES